MYVCLYICIVYVCVMLSEAVTMLVCARVGWSHKIKYRWKIRLPVKGLANSSWTMGKRETKLQHFYIPKSDTAKITWFTVYACNLCLSQCGTCTLREATIVASVLAKNSVPLLHSAAAIIKIAEMDYNGANSIFLRTLLDKKYALPYQAVDAVVYHFLR